MIIRVILLSGKRWPKLLNDPLNKLAERKPNLVHDLTKSSVVLAPAAFIRLQPEIEACDVALTVNDSEDEIALRSVEYDELLRTICFPAEAAAERAERRKELERKKSDDKQS